MLNRRPEKKMQGAILIMVLWMIMLGLILVTAIAANIRLSAMTVIHHQEALQDWSAILETVNKAHMELIIDKMPKITADTTSLYNRVSKENRFDGRLITLSYDTPKDIRVRIYDLSGKINIARLNQKKLTDLLEQQLGEGNKKIPELVDAWLDWVDSDNLKRLNGAEEAYYRKEHTGYEPRNGLLTSVDEIRWIKGFDEVFADIDVSAVFTLLGNASGAVNPATASREVLLMLPGMNETLADNLIKARKTQPFKNMAEVSVHLTPTAIKQLTGWFIFQQSSYYAIVVYPDSNVEKNKKTQTVYAYKEEVRVVNASRPPVVLSVTPYAKVTIEN
ncbi:MAG: general secretion pathway protein GspK [gamma proteobacterium symbiont of Bathyaustriella thionipta]|nr:general secretion pathway protein GspK [gamma proteobacterium symbiont of Bathyaustriella thionipta]MCU7951315.1 general secretion pathway protein GspK [gamma proteobacterium symbiont of Bathyaustriella thionipta]MCU7952190.1 general secretion pathway protein GspK [gamma proteobacterium symbiont of Bathyaustriella thionipta]MCU7957870.1 general secretion pathway protein GspK [gamma proteobacterium symbiont of Bathyaustriella thionipta]MCU7968597.1 general secretion pathway protein GspK [gamm